MNEYDRQKRLELNPVLREGMLKAEINEKRVNVDHANFHYKKAFGIIPSSVKHALDAEKRGAEIENTREVEQEFN